MNHLKKIIILTSIFFLFVSSSYSQDIALRVEIKPEQQSVKNGEEFSVMTKIINTSHKDQHLQVWSCSYYDNWIINSPWVQLKAWPCKENAVDEVVLKSGEIYENKLSLKIGVPAEEILVREVTFKLGFKMAPSDSSNPLIETPVVWSNLVTIQIKE